MQVEGFFEWLGQAFGDLIRFIVEALGGLFDLLGDAFSGFLAGLSKSLGIDATLLSLVVLLLGLLLLYAALRALLRKRIILALVWLLLGLWLLSSLIR